MLSIFRSNQAGAAQDGQIVYSFFVDESLPMTDLAAHTLVHLQEKMNFQALSLPVEGSQLLQYRPKGGIRSMFSGKQAFHLEMILQDNRCTLFLYPAEWIEPENLDQAEIKPTKAKMLADSGQESIFNFVGQYLINFHLDVKKRNDHLGFIEPWGVFIQTKHPYVYNFLLQTQAESDPILAMLEVSEVRKLSTQKDLPKDILWFTVASFSSLRLIGFTKDGQLHTDLSISGPVEVKDEIGRDTVSAPEATWLTTLRNDDLFRSLMGAHAHGAPVRVYALLAQIFSHAGKELPKAQVYLTLWFDLLEKQAPSPLINLSRKFAQQWQASSQTAFSQADLPFLLPEVQDIFTNAHNPWELLWDWVNVWKLSFQDAALLIEALLSLDTALVDPKVSLSFHDKVRSAFLQSKLSLPLRVKSELAYLLHLMMAERTHDAVALIQEFALRIPDESLLSLSPLPKLDLSKAEAGAVLQALFWQWLGVLTPEKKASFDLLIAQAFPLSIELLSDVETPASKELMALMQPGALSANDTQIDIKFRQLTAQDQNRLAHPTLREKGRFHDLYKWAAKVPYDPVVKEIKDYLDPIDTAQYPWMNNIISDILYALELPSMPCYLARGAHKVGIAVYEHEHPFLVIGSEHLNTNSPHALNYKELEFVIGAELFKFASKTNRLTATKAWQDYRQNPKHPLEALNSLPSLTLFTQEIKHLEELETLVNELSEQQTFFSHQIAQKLPTHFLDKAKFLYGQASKQIPRSEGIYQSITSALSLSNPFKLYELLTACRLVSINADRAGLLFCNEPKSAIRAIIKSDPLYCESIQELVNIGIGAFVALRTPSGECMHQDLAIRISGIFSFYLSEDFELLRSHLVK